jgi:flagellar protein FlgJ
MELGSILTQNVHTAGYVPFSQEASQSGSPGSFDRLLETAKRTAQTEVNDTPLPKTAHIDKESKLYEQCLALETFMMKNIINGMRNTVMKSELIDTGFAGKMYEDMLWDEYTKDFTANANMGMAELAYLELTGQRGKLLGTA